MKKTPSPFATAIHVRSTTLRIIADDLEKAVADDNMVKMISLTGSLSKVSEDLLTLLSQNLHEKN